MPTVVDSLIVELGLDPTGFDAGQRKALQQLRGFEKEASSSSNRVAESGDKIRMFFQAANHPIQTAQQGLMGLATQSHRTGQSVSAGALAGAAGLRVLAVSALVALAAFKGIQKTIGAVQKQMTDTTMTGFMAQWAGVSPEWMTRLSMAAYHKTRAPQEQTQNWLMGLQSQVQAFVTGGSMAQSRPTPLLQGLLRMGLNPLAYRDAKTGNVNMPEFMRALENKLQSYSPTQLTGFANQLGMPLLLAQFLSTGAAAVHLAAAQERVYETTKHQTKEMLALGQAERQVELATDALTREFATQLAPSLINILNVVRKFLGWIPSFFKDLNELTTKVPWLKKIFGSAVFAMAGPLGALATLAGIGAKSGGTTSKSSTDWTNVGNSMKPPTATEIAMARLVAQKESGDRNVPNYLFSPDRTAQGYWQITDTNWRQYAPLVGIDTTRYPEAMDAPKDLQFRVYLYMKRHFGLKPWDKAHGGSMPVQTGANTSPVLTSHDQHMAAIRAGMARSSTSVNNGNNSMTNNIAINVPPGSNAEQIGAVVSHSIKREVMATNYNTGFE